MEKAIFNHLTDTLRDGAVIINAGEGHELSMQGSSISMQLTTPMTNGQFGLYEIVLAPKTVGAQMHYHRFMDETFIVNKGVLTILLSDREVQAQAGSVVYVPRFTPHGFANNSEEPVVLHLLFNPGQDREGFFFGLEEILNEQPIDPKKFGQLYAKYDTIPVDTGNMLPVKK